MSEKKYINWKSHYGEIKRVEKVIKNFNDKKNQTEVLIFI